MSDEFLTEPFAELFSDERVVARLAEEAAEFGAVLSLNRDSTEEGSDHLPVGYHVLQQEAVVGRRDDRRRDRGPTRPLREASSSVSSPAR